jgi:sarcosine oxidase subunit alpha
MLPAVERGEPVNIIVDGQQLSAYQGETIATVLAVNGRRAYRYSSQPAETPLPGFFCGMGLCYGCTVLVDGYLKRACLTHVVEGMEITTRPEVRG